MEPAAERILGRTRDEAIGLKLKDFLPAEAVKAAQRLGLDTSSWLTAAPAWRGSDRDPLPAA